jgi:hypothetical protein
MLYVELRKSRYRRSAWDAAAGFLVKARRHLALRKLIRRTRWRNLARQAGISK